MAEDYTEKSARARITRNGGKFKGKQIVIVRAGLKVLSAIDYLVNEHRYSWIPDSGGA
jgi:hypothetical protein